MFRMTFLTFAACLALGMAGSATAAAEKPLPSVDDFFASPAFDGAVLSPDGRNLAMLVRGPEGHIVLANMPTAGGPTRILAGVKDMDVIDIHWVNNRRLVFSAYRPDAEEGERSTSIGLHAVNVDGSKHILLVAHQWRSHTHDPALPPNTYYLDSVHDDKSSDVYVIRNNIFKENFEGFALFRLNTETANLVAVDAPERFDTMLIDGAGTPRVATRMQDGRSHLLYHDPAGGKWRELGAYAPTSPDYVVPRLVTGAGDLYVSSNHGRDTVGLYRLDVNSGQLDPQPMVGLQKFDFNGSILLAPDRDHVLGVRYETSEPMTTWLDADMQQVQQRVDALLPATINELHVASDATADAVVVHSFSDTEPGFWHLYHLGSGKLTPLGTSRPQIDPARMADTSFAHVKARDGRDLPVYLTLPKGERRKVPMVVLLHGGPWLRGAHLRWDPQVQFLASRGYAVLQPEFRGSQGFGRAHFTAGWKQWGQAMQDDVADATRWAVAQGAVDGGRICIAGGDYGGYATLMGLVRNPDLYRCGIDWAGMTDINALFDTRFTNVSQDAKTYTLPALIGNPDGDAAMLKAASPLEHADAIKQPLLLAYGNKDRLLPIEQGRRFHEAVARGNPHVEWVEYEDEGHVWRYEHTRRDFWMRVEKFLHENLDAH